MSEKHLQCYVDEFAFRWNTRSARGVEDFERANHILKGAKGKRLTIGGLTKLRTLKQKARHFLRWRRGVIGS